MRFKVKFSQLDSSGIFSRQVLLLPFEESVSLTCHVTLAVTRILQTRSFFSFPYSHYSLSNPSFPVPLSHANRCTVCC